MDNIKIHSIKKVKERDVKKGILLVAFGSRESSANIALSNIYNKVSKAFSKIEIRWAYTSSFIRKKLNESGISIDSPLVAISKMIDEGFTHIAVQSMHTIPGSEYDYLISVVEQIKGVPKDTVKLVVGRPLLYFHHDIEATVDAMIKSYPSVNENEAILWMGHGSPHFSNVFYPAINYYFSHKTNNTYMATVEGYPSIYDIVECLKSKKYSRIRLIPFVSVVGNHVKKDMCGMQKDSWQNILENAGYDVSCELKGTGQMDRIVSVWLDHLKDVWQKLK